MTAKTSNKPTPQQQTASAAGAEHTNLSRRYGVIGIKCVAAAARYNDQKKPAPVNDPRFDQRFVESAA